MFRKISELGTIVGGGTPSTKNPGFYSDSGIGWITPKDLSGHRGRFISNGERDISPEGLRKSSARLMPKGTVLFSSRAPIGYVAIASRELCTSQGFKSIVPNETCDSVFLYYLMRFYAPKIESIAGGSTFKEVSAKVLGDFMVRVPESIEEQRSISAVLSAFDNKIELNWKINDNLLKQCSLFYELAVSGAPFSKLRGLIEIVEAGKRPRGGAERSGIPSIGAEKIERFGIYDFSSEKYISPTFFANLKRGRVKNGDVLLYKDGAYTGKVSLALDGFPHEICAVNEHVFLLRTRDLSSQFFLYFTLSSSSVMEKIHTLSCAKAAQPGLNQKELVSVEAPLPPKEAIRNFEIRVDPFMHKVAKNALENRELAKMRDMLLPKLLKAPSEEFF